MLEYSKDNNINYIKFQKGTYLVNNSVKINSNMEIDLNSSTITMQPNDKTGYTILTISNKENVKIKNGNLIGDKDVHDYVGTSTHQWGMGIYILGAKNIEIENMNISMMTGDGIYISNSNDNSNNIKIKNSLIHDNRRQGISIISGENILIDCNEIYNIDGIPPQAGIDLEANNSKQKIDNIYIRNNKFYNFKDNIAILIFYQIYNVEISNNIIEGDINIYETKMKTDIINNKLFNGNIGISYDKPDNPKVINEINIKDNQYKNYELLYNEDKVNTIIIEDNEEI